MALQTLNLRGLSKLTLEKDLVESSFDRISRYYITARILKTLLPSDKATVLDVGGLGTILPRLIKNKVTILDVDQNDDPNYVQGDATKQPFKDNHFNVVVTCDTLEHIPQAKRQAFVSELVRVSSDLVIICAPFDKGSVAESEKDMNAFYKKLSGTSHRWLEEHIDIGIPKEADIEATLEKLPISFVKFGHTDIEIWRALVEANFLSECLPIDDLREQIAAVNTYYNKELLEEDFSDDAYRQFYVISKTQELKLAPMTQEKSKKSPRKLLRTNLHNTYTSIINTNGHEILAKIGRISNLESELKSSQTIIKDLQKELKDIKTSKGWKLVSKYHTVASHVRKG